MNKNAHLSLLKIMLAVWVLILMSGIASAKSQFSVLVFTKTAGFHHKSIPAGVAAFETLSKRHAFSMQWHEDAKYFNDDYLAKFDVVVFLSTSGDALNDSQQAAFERFIRSGKGYVGIHGASATERQWPWYGQLVGRYFIGHPAIQTARLIKTDNDFPGLESWPITQWWTDEWYHFTELKVDSVNVILQVDESTYDTIFTSKGQAYTGMGEAHPIAWYHEFDGGRSFYTSLGHISSTYEMEAFQQHIYGGLLWAATGKGLD